MLLISTCLVLTWSRTEHLASHEPVTRTQCIPRPSRMSFCLSVTHPSCPYLSLARTPVCMHAPTHAPFQTGCLTSKLGGAGAEIATKSAIAETCTIMGLGWVSDERVMVGIA